MKASICAPILCALIGGLSSVALAAVVADEAAGQTPDLVGRTVQRTGSSLIGLVVVSVPVDAASGGEAVAVAQAKQLRGSLSKQGVDAANIYVEARPSAPAVR